MVNKVIRTGSLAQECKICEFKARETFFLKNNKKGKNSLYSSNGTGEKINHWRGISGGVIFARGGGAGGSELIYGV